MSRLFTKSKNSMEQYKLFNEHQKNVKKFQQTTTAQTIESAKNDAVVNPPSKDVNPENLPETRKTKGACSKILAEVNKTAIGILDTSLTNYQQSDAKIQDKDDITTKINDLKNEKKEAKDDLKTDYDKRDASLETRQNDANDDLKNYKLDLQSKTKHNLFWRCLFAVVLMGVAAGTEVSYTAKAFELTGLSFYEKYLVAIGLGICTIFIGAGTIELLLSKMKNYWKAISSVSLFLLICGVYYALGKLRVSLVEKEMVSGVDFDSLFAFDFMLINLIFYVAIMLIHWVLWPKKSKFSENKEYKTVQDKIDKEEKKIEKIGKQRQNLPVELRKAQVESAKKYDDAIAEIETEYFDYGIQRAENQTTYNNVLGRVMQFYDEMNFFYKETAGLYISTMNRYRKDKVFITIDIPLSDLPNPFKKFNYLDNNTSENEEIAEAPKLDVANIDINFDELLTNTNNTNYEDVKNN